MRSYASSEGLDEPARLQKIARALTPQIYIERIKMKIHV